MPGGPDVLNVRGLRVEFGPRAMPVRAVDGATFDVRHGTTAALVGESGCGKTVTALALARLLGPGARYVAGEIFLCGRNVLSMTERELSDVRGRDISYVFQEPASALNPVFRIGYQIMEAIRLHRPEADPRAEAEFLLRMVGIPDPGARLRSYPHELSGGMQQRVMIAMALACRPKLLVADEPTTALDVTIQAQILELMSELQKKLGMAILLITHNLGLVADIAETVNVMYAGRIVESGPTEQILRSPAHPYTEGLIRAVPRLSDSRERRTGIDGSVPDPARLPPGCKFAPRCPRAKEECSAQEPTAAPAAHGGWVKCRFPNQRGWSI